MSATTDQMTAATVSIEAALVQLGAALASYDAGRAAAKQARAAAQGLARGEDIDNAISTSQLNRVIAGRLRALGAEHLLHDASSGLTPQSASWVAAWNANVTAIVP